MRDFDETANGTLTDFEPADDGPNHGESTVVTRVDDLVCSSCGVSNPLGGDRCWSCNHWLHKNKAREKNPRVVETEEQRAAYRERLDRDLGGNLPLEIAETVDDFVSTRSLRREQSAIALDPTSSKPEKREALKLYFDASIRMERLSIQLTAYREDVRGRTPVDPVLSNLTDDQMVERCASMLKAAEMIRDRHRREPVRDAGENVPDPIILGDTSAEDI